MSPAAAAVVSGRLPQFVTGATPVKSLRGHATKRAQGNKSSPGASISTFAKSDRDISDFEGEVPLASAGLGKRHRPPKSSPATTAMGIAVLSEGEGLRRAKQSTVRRKLIRVMKRKQMVTLATRGS
ncbi:hypothetical protein D9757_012155 [Collybiopsis confluens]|uniref:Uncharacterized protein n=1 Tax=Collybiopsis confluens TaxID=2823264 RepID=A0A8H5G7T9_9AGAR|nr:hypothetical protein D9757_012155 [Collybiopsis confluens]